VAVTADGVEIATHELGGAGDAPVLVATDLPLGRDDRSWMAEQARRRRTTFASRAEARRHFGSRSPLDAVDAEVLDAYVAHGFEDTEDGGVRLKCRSLDEAAVYATATAHDAYGRLGQVLCRVAVARGSASDVPPPDTGLLPQPTTLVLDGLGHLGPLERPQQVAGSVLDFLAGCER
jgi:pimeloyl-ACP methyl ester carboxylesterase